MYFDLSDLPNADEDMQYMRKAQTNRLLYGASPCISDLILPLRIVSFRYYMFIVHDPIACYPISVRFYSARYRGQDETLTVTGRRPCGATCKRLQHVTHPPTSRPVPISEIVPLPLSICKYIGQAALTRYLSLSVISL